MIGEAVANDIMYELLFSGSGSPALGCFRRFEGRAAVIDFWRGTPGGGMTAAPPADCELSIVDDGTRLFIEQRGNITMAGGDRYRNRFDKRDGPVVNIREYINPIISAFAFNREIAGGLKVESLPA